MNTRELGEVFPAEVTLSPMPRDEPFVNAVAIRESGHPLHKVITMRRGPWPVPHIGARIFLNGREMHPACDGGPGWRVIGRADWATVVSLPVPRRDLAVVEHMRPAGASLYEVKIRTLDGTWWQTLGPADHTLLTGGDGPALPTLAGLHESDPGLDMFTVHLYASRVVIE